MKISTKAPCRVDLAGGTLDIWPLYLYHPDAVTVNVAINCYATCVLETRADSKIILRSKDHKVEESFDSLVQLAGTKKYRLPLLAYLVRYFKPATGFVIDTDSESPTGAGIAGSSTLIIAVSTALNKLTGMGHKPEKLREISQNVEAQIIRVPTGAQDYYPALYGAVSAIELTEAGIVRKAIPVDLDELNQRLVVAYTGEPRNSGINNWEVTKAYIDGDKKVHANFDRIAAISYAMRQALERADWNEAGRLLRQEWDHRRKNAPGITTDLIDRLVAASRKAGALGGKVCGAGGGGCVLFLTDKGRKPAVEQAIVREGATLLPVVVAPKGVQLKVSA